MIPPLPLDARVLDIGCGPGMQTVDLARLTGCPVTALDNYEPLLDELRQSIEEAGFSGNITPVNGSMFDLPFPEGTFDLIWAEGSIYIMGFDAGLAKWKSFLKPRGCVAVTELTWLQDNPPLEARSFWNREYPAMRDVERNCAGGQAQGYSLLGCFPLPERAWWDSYYTPLEERVALLRRKYAGNTESLGVLQSIVDEIDLYRKYSDWYGYVFYVFQRKD
jgi:SAM-dependent methyltransferase